MRSCSPRRPRKSTQAALLHDHAAGRHAQRPAPHPARSAGVAVDRRHAPGTGRDRAAGALEQPLRARARRRRAAPSPDLAADAPHHQRIRRQAILAGYGLPVTRETLGDRRSQQAIDAAAAIGYPVVLKVVSDDIPHKSEHGLVAVGIADEQALAAAFDDDAGACRARSARPIAGYLVQEMVADGVEVFAGIARDPDFGLSLAFGMGGVGVEVLRDFALRPLPLREGDAEAMIARDPRRRAARRLPRPPGGRHGGARAMPLRAVGFRRRQQRRASTRSTSIRSRRAQRGLRHRRCADRPATSR